MSLGSASLVAHPLGWRIDRQPGPDLAAYLQSRPVAEAAELLPRLFNLCRMAQSSAARLSLGLPATEGDPAAEVIHDHMARLFVTLRRAFDLAPLIPPRATPNVFGPLNQLPRDPGGLTEWFMTDNPLAELGRAVQAGLPLPFGQTPNLPGAAPQTGAMENSPAQRQAHHPLMQTLAHAQGRSPLWRFAGLLVDLQAALSGALPAPRLFAGGMAQVEAARGTYFLRIGQQSGRVTDLTRITPTDHQLAPKGALELALTQVPTDRPDLVSRLVALFDPCIPVTVPQVHHA